MTVASPAVLPLAARDSRAVSVVPVWYVFVGRSLLGTVAPLPGYYAEPTRDQCDVAAADVSDRVDADDVVLVVSYTNERTAVVDRVANATRTAPTERRESVSVVVVAFERDTTTSARDSAGADDSSAATRTPPSTHTADHERHRPHVRPATPTRLGRNELTG